MTTREWIHVASYRGYRTLRTQDTSASRHSGTLRHRSQDTLTPKNVVQDTSTRVPWSRKSPDTSTQDNSDETHLHRWFVLNFGTNFVVPKCPRVSWCRSVRLPVYHSLLVPDMLMLLGQVELPIYRFSSLNVDKFVFVMMSCFGVHIFLILATTKSTSR